MLAGAALKIGAQSAEDDPQPAIANLPENITVELVGVTFHTSSNEPEPDWWTPSGGPLANVPNPRKSFLGETAPEKHRIFGVKVRGTPESTAVNVRVSRADDRVDFFTWGGGYAGKESDPPLFWMAGPFVKGKQTTVRVMLLVDDWGPVQQVSTEAQRIDEPQLLPIYQRCYANIAPQKVEERSRLTALTFHWPADQDYLATFEAWAVDKQGTRLRSGETAGPINAREFTFDGPLSEIDHFEYRLRPFRHWVTFENVSVKPGHHTPVKVTVESFPGETAEGQEHAAVEEAIEVESASDEPEVAYPGIEFRIAAGEADRDVDGVVWLPIVEPRVPVPGGKSGANMPVEEKRENKWHGLVWETTAHAMLADGTWQIKQCDVVPSQFGTGLRKQFHIQIELDAAGGEQMRLLTTTHLKQAMAIVVNGTIISAPVIQATINNKMLIVGNYNEEAATKLADAIRKGRAKPDAETIVGTVVSPDGQPIVGIEVLAFEGAMKAPRQLEQTFRTDENGQFRVPKVWHEVEHRLTLVARQGNEQLGWFDFALHQPSATSPEPEDGSFQLMLLPMSRDVRGRILDESGMPLAKASVRISSLEHAVNSAADNWIDQTRGDEPLLKRAVTDEDGTFELRLPKDSAATLTVSYPEQITEWIHVPKDEVNVTDTKLDKATKVIGKVLDSRTGMPISGVVFGLRMANHPKSKHVQLPRGRAIRNNAAHEFQVGVWATIATTDANGDYRISGLRRGEYTIEFMNGVDPILAAPGITNVVLESCDTLHADFELMVGKHLTGHVIDDETGEPVSGCTVTYSGHSRNNSTGLETTSNEKGEFQFLVPPGRCRLNATADRFPVEGSVRNLDIPDEGEPQPVVLKAGLRRQPIIEGF
jgi:protocatechuate 3,4-dioxygenase beta subunit